MTTEEKTMKEYSEECKNCMEITLGINMKCINGGECEIKEGHFEAHQRELCSTCTVYGCSNNPKGSGIPGAPLFFAIPEGCVYIDCDSSI